MKRIFALLGVAALGLSACADQQPAGTIATVTNTVTTTPTPTSTAGTTLPATSTAAAPAAEEPTGRVFAPGDPRLVSVNSIGKAGLFLDPDTGKYYVCNGGELTAAQGAPVESGTCDGPFSDYYAAGELNQRMGYAIAGAIEQEAINEGLIDAPVAVDEGDITARFWECMESGGTEETCRQ